MVKSSQYTRPSDGKTVRLGIQEAEQADITARAKRVLTVGPTGLPADVIQTDGHNGIVAIAPGHVSTDNSVEDPDLLLSDEVFTGEWENITNFGVIVISVTSDVASATDGLMVQFSTQGSIATLISDDVFTIVAGAKKTFSFQAASKFYRIIYTNGGIDQGHFHLQTVLKPYYVKPSSHRIADNISGQDDAELVKAVLTGKNPQGTFVNVQTTAAGNLKVGIEEYDEKVDPIRKDMEGGGKVSVGTSPVEVTFTGTPTHSIIITADSANTGILYIGKSDVTNTGANAITFLKRYDSVEISYDDTDNAVYVVSDTASQNFWKGALI